jgi:hypothetical protein
MENNQPVAHHVGDGVYQNVFSYWKAGILGAVIVGASGALGYYLHRMVYAASAMSNTDWIFAGTIFLAVCVLAALEAIFVSYRPMGYGTFVVAALALSAGGCAHFSQAIVGGCVVAVACFAAAYSRGQKELEEAIKIRFFSVVRIVIPVVVMGVSVFVGTMLYGAVATQPLSDVASLLLPRSLFQTILVRSSGLLAPAFGGDVDFSLSLRQLTARAVDNALIESGVPASSLSPTAKDQLVQKYLPDIEKKFEMITGGPMQLDEPIAQALYDGLASRLNALEGNAKIMTLVAVIVLVVLTLMAFIPLLNFVVGGIGFVVYELLLAIGFGVITHETRSKEVVVLP